MNTNAVITLKLWQLMTKLYQNMGHSSLFLGLGSFKGFHLVMLMKKVQTRNRVSIQVLNQNVALTRTMRILCLIEMIVNVCTTENANNMTNESLPQDDVPPTAVTIPKVIHGATGMAMGEGVKLSQVVTRNAQRVVENISLPSGKRVLQKFTSKGYKSPPHNSNPPYYVEYPPERVIL